MTEGRAMQNTGLEKLENLNNLNSGLGKFEVVKHNC